jgi:hypothetical protein
LRPARLLVAERDETQHRAVWEFLQRSVETRISEIFKS